MQLRADQQNYSYIVEFEGIQNSKVLDLLKATSQTIALQNQPPDTSAGLRHRAEADITIFLKALQSLAYYHSKVQFHIEFDSEPIKVIFTIETGSIYHFGELKLVLANDNDTCANFLGVILAEDLGIEMGKPAYPKIIIEAEEELLSILEEQGYPLAKMAKREVIADENNQRITVVLQVDSGPLAVFGETEIVGQETVSSRVFNRKIAWCEGSPYDPDKVDRTLRALEASGLFSSITITHLDTLDANGRLPMQINVDEARHRSVAFGLGYATDLGPGINAEWEHRNVRGMGERFSAVANLWWIKQQGLLRYIQPDFLAKRQDLIWQLSVDHETTKGFREASASFSGILERQINDHLRVSYGGMYMWLKNTHSDNNRSFNLIKAPLQLMWNKTNNLLDPTTGLTVHVKATPTLQVLDPCFAYSTHTVTTTGYIPLDHDHRFVLAGKASLGSIWGASKHSIPPSERFYAGSDTLLRGYRYWTVSPLDDDDKPIGGRSLMVLSLEARYRVTKSFGIVAFYDIGNVYSTSIPQVNHKQLQSVGIGLRYHTPVGPLRMDIAIPLNPRRHLDSGFQLYFGIGQTF